YGDRLLNEHDELKPATHYGVFKRANEENARIFYKTNGLASIGLRPWSVYGVGRDLGLTADPTLAMRAVAQQRPYQIRITGNVDLQYAQDVAGTFLGCALSPLEGAHVFNLSGHVVSIDALIERLEVLRPGARKLITASGPQVPVAYRMDSRELDSKIPGLRRTPLEEGMERTIELFERLHAEGRLA
ncbi:MAG: epimerase, partial [Acidobacteria bacterium]|nr:epimerase [Acidobacteriota bacterium]